MLSRKRSSRSEEHTSELQSHSFISYAVFCLKKKNKCAPLGHPDSQTSPSYVAQGTRPRSGVPRSAARVPHEVANGTCAAVLFFFFLMTGRPPKSPLFPSPPLFRSLHVLAKDDRAAAEGREAGDDVLDRRVVPLHRDARRLRLRGLGAMRREILVDRHRLADGRRGDARRLIRTARHGGRRVIGRVVRRRARRERGRLRSEGHKSELHPNSFNSY